MEANSWAGLGLILGDQDRWVESGDAYGRALALWREQNDQLNVALAQAGLAWAAQARGETAQAQMHVEGILPHLHESEKIFSVVLGPYTVYLTCYRVLAAVGDPRAAGVLEQAHGLVQERAARIPDPEQRRSCTENLIEVRAILAEHARLYGTRTGVEDAPGWRGRTFSLHHGPGVKPMSMSALAPESAPRAAGRRLLAS